MANKVGLYNKIIHDKHQNDYFLDILNFLYMLKVFKVEIELEPSSPNTMISQL